MLPSEFRTVLSTYPILFIEKSLQRSPWIFVDDDDDDDDDDDVDDELFCGTVDWRKAFNLSSSWDHFQRSSSLRISNTPWTGFKPEQKLSSGSGCKKLRSSENHHTNFFYICYINNPADYSYSYGIKASTIYG